jgi:hypothetical protein
MNLSISPWDGGSGNGKSNFRNNSIIPGECQPGVGRNKRQSIAPHEEGSMRCAYCTLQAQVMHGVIEKLQIFVITH